MRKIFLCIFIMALILPFYGISHEFTVYSEEDVEDLFSYTAEESGEYTYEIDIIDYDIGIDWTAALHTDCNEAGLELRMPFEPDFSPDDSYLFTLYDRGKLAFLYDQDLNIQLSLDGEDASIIERNFQGEWSEEFSGFLLSDMDTNTPHTLESDFTRTHSFEATNLLSSPLEVTSRVEITDIAMKGDIHIELSFHTSGIQVKSEDKSILYEKEDWLSEDIRTEKSQAFPDATTLLWEGKTFQPTAKFTIKPQMLLYYEVDYWLGTYDGDTGWQKLNDITHTKTLDDDITLHSEPVQILRNEYDAQVVEYEIPPLNKGREDEIIVTFLNTGTEPWEKGGDILLGAVDNSDELVISENWRVHVTQDVLPAEEYSFTLTVFPEERGTFLTQWQMLKEGEFWFGDMFSQNIEVREATDIDGNIWQIYR